MNAVVSVDQSLWCRLAVSFVAAYFLAGCATDMRCQCASDRIKMHEGTPWHLRDETDDERARREKEAAVFLALSNAVRSPLSPEMKKFVSSIASQPRKFCPKQALTCSGTEVISTAPISFVESWDEYDFDLDEVAQILGPPKAEPAETPAKKRCLSLAEEAALQRGEQVEFNRSIPEDSKEARRRYLEGRQAFLAAGKLNFADGGEPIELYLVNEGLNCHLPGDRRKQQWRCRKLKDLPVSAAQGDTWKGCRKKIGNTMSVVNLLGVVDDRYCVAVKVYETKAEKVETEVPTNIDFDSLSVQMVCLLEDNAAPGVVVGGPKTNSRNPLVMAPAL